MHLCMCKHYGLVNFHRRIQITLVYVTMVTASNITQTIPQYKFHSTSTSARTILIAVIIIVTIPSTLDYSHKPNHTATKMSLVF